MRTLLSLIVFLAVLITLLSFVPTADAGRRDDPWGDVFRDIVEDVVEEGIDEARDTRRDQRRAERDRERAQERAERERRREAERRARDERRARENAERDARRHQQEQAGEEAELERDIRREQAEAELEERERDNELDRTLEERIRVAEVSVYEQYMEAAIERGEKPMTFDEWRLRRRQNEALRRHGYAIPDDAGATLTDPGPANQASELESRLHGLEQTLLKKELEELGVKIDKLQRLVAVNRELLQADNSNEQKERVASYERKLNEATAAREAVNAKLAKTNEKE